MKLDCENCVTERRIPKPAVILADGMPLCADCSARLKGDYEQQMAALEKGGE